MAKRKSIRDLRERMTHIVIGEEFSDEEAEEIIREEVGSVVKETIEERKREPIYPVPAKRPDIGIILGPDSHEAWVSIRKKVYYKLSDCEYISQCNRFKSADICFTKRYANCINYKEFTRKGKIQKVFSSRYD